MLYLVLLSRTWVIHKTALEGMEHYWILSSIYASSWTFRYIPGHYLLFPIIAHLITTLLLKMINLRLASSIWLNFNRSLLFGFILNAIKCSYTIFGFELGSTITLVLQTKRLNNWTTKPWNTTVIFIRWYLT